MPDQENDAEPPPEIPAAKRPWADNPKLRFAVILLGIVATLVGILVGVRGLLNPTSTVAPTSASPSSATRTSINPPASSESADTGAPSSAAAGAADAAEAGECLAEGGGSVPCTAVHRFETIGAAGEPCDSAAATRYFGGNPSVDVPRVTIEMKFGACVVSSADQNDWHEPVRDAFAADNDSGFWNELRSCVDDRLSQHAVVSCAVKHTGEYVGVAEGVVPDAEQCLAAADEYLGASLERGAKPELTAVTLMADGADDSGPQCMVAVRGNNVLTASVRNIRTRALPLSES